MTGFSAAMASCGMNPTLDPRIVRKAEGVYADTFALVGLHGIRYRRDVSSSLTRLDDERQFDFIPAFERIIRSVATNRDASTLIPKALESYCAVLCHHVNQRNRYPPELQRKLRASIAASLARLPVEELHTAIAALDVERAATVENLLLAAA